MNFPLPYNYVLDPAAPPPNLYMIPDLMGSSMAPHTAHVNWRPFTPKSKYTSVGNEMSILILNTQKMTHDW